MDENYTFETRHVNAIAWNSSGTKVAITTSDWGDTDDIYVNHRLKIIDAASARIEVDIPAECDYFPNNLAWRKDNTEIALISVGGEFRCFDVQAGCKLVNQWEIDGLIQADFNPSRTDVGVVRRVTGRGRPINEDPQFLEVYDTETGLVLESNLIDPQQAAITDWFGWSPDGTRLAMTNRKGNVLIYEWNGATFAFQHEFTFTAADRIGITLGAWGSDSRHIALNISYTNTSPSEIVIYNTDSRQIVQRLDQSMLVETLAWNTATNLIAGRPQHPGPDYRLKVWDGATGQIVGTGEDRYLVALAWSRDGRLAAGGVIEYEEWLQDQTKTGLSIYRPQMLITP